MCTDVCGHVWSCFFCFYLVSKKCILCSISKSLNAIIEFPFSAEKQQLTLDADYFSEHEAKKQFFAPAYEM